MASTHSVVRMNERFDVREAALWRIVLLLLLALVSSCSGKAKQGVPVAGKPLSRSLSLVTADGSADVRTALSSGGTASGDWSSMKRGVSVAGAMEVRGHDDGAVLDVMDGERRIGK